MDRVLLFHALVIGSAGFALWRGGAPERWVALIFLAADVPTLVIRNTVAAPFETAASELFLIDLVVFAALLAVALKANRDWPMWIAAWQLVGVSTHVVMLFDASIIKWVYAIMHAALSYPMLGLLVVGTVRHRRRLARNGADASWSR